MRTIAVIAAFAAAQASFLESLQPQLPGSLCSPCVQLGQQGISTLLNYLLNAGVVSSCSKLCSNLETKTEQTVCNLACDLVGIKAFVSALNHTDLDPIYFCEVLTACPAGPDDADAKLLKAEATPSSLSKGDKVQLLCDLNVTKASGVGEYSIAVQGPVSGDISSSFLLPKGLDVGVQQLGVELKVKDQTSGDEPVVWQPGDYQFDFQAVPCHGAMAIRCISAIVPWR
mmetsp:Transcript_3060/g.3484  ORF Transcript_3060/g.3484 Transcript_3060/m.3484 type:complete len:228 (+) Transcript_3060:62-745(+)